MLPPEKYFQAGLGAPTDARGRTKCQTMHFGYRPMAEGYWTNRANDYIINRLRR
jgi:hypothetical protein